MCLTKITKKIAVPTNDIITVWKAFDSDHELKVLTSYYQYDLLFENRVGRWLKADEHEICASDGQIYNTGFHAFRHIHEAKSEIENYGDTIFLPVEFRYVTVHGIDHGIQTIVAKEMRIPRYWKKKAIRL